MSAGLRSMATLVVLAAVIVVCSAAASDSENGQAYPKLAGGWNRQ